MTNTQFLRALGVTVWLAVSLGTLIHRIDRYEPGFVAVLGFVIVATGILGFVLSVSSGERKRSKVHAQPTGAAEARPDGSSRSRSA